MTLHAIGIRLAMLAGAAVLSAGPQAAAQDESADASGVHVTSAGLDTSAHAGASAMLRRIRAAAERICVAEDTKVFLGCMRESVADAVGRLDDPGVTAAFRRRG